MHHTGTLWTANPEAGDLWSPDPTHFTKRLLACSGSLGEKSASHWVILVCNFAFRDSHFPAPHAPHARPDGEVDAEEEAPRFHGPTGHGTNIRGADTNQSRRFSLSGIRVTDTLYPD